MAEPACFVGQVRLDCTAWLEVCRCTTRGACEDQLLASEPPKGTITVERRVVEEVKQASGSKRAESFASGP
jgi:hypothetical protein